MDDVKRIQIRKSVPSPHVLAEPPPEPRTCLSGLDQVMVPGELEGWTITSKRIEPDAAASEVTRAALASLFTRVDDDTRRASQRTAGDYRACLTRSRIVFMISPAPFCRAR